MTQKTDSPKTWETSFHFLGGRGNFSQQKKTWEIMRTSTDCLPHTAAGPGLRGGPQRNCREEPWRGDGADGGQESTRNVGSSSTNHDIKHKNIAE